MSESFPAISRAAEAVSHSVPLVDPGANPIVVAGVGRAGQLGEALAQHLAHLGYSLALISRSAGEASERMASLEKHRDGQFFSAHAADLSNAGAAVSAAAEVMHAHKTSHVHALVCVAGGFGMTGPIGESDPDAWHKQFAINLDTAWATTRAFLPALRDSQGSIVYFSSAAALPGGNSKGMAAYAAAKSGVLSLMRTVALEEKANGVRSNAIAPTAIRTASNMASMGERISYVERESVAEVVGFLVGNSSRNVTGQVITLG